SHSDSVCHVKNKEFIPQFSPAAGYDGKQVISVRVKRLAGVIAEMTTEPLLLRLQAHYHYLVGQITEIETALSQEIIQDDTGQRLMTIPGIGPITASVLSAQLGDGKHYARSRDFAASTGLVPRQYSTGGRTTLLGISKRGNKTLRQLLVLCARSFMQQIEHRQGK
ncbi:transposase, partial [Xenorhabdus vietnamensis]|uniref:transposase n=1 Tax=Xenorhabdus vietnamensis TaxID=351656 RepID=UPI001FCA0885